MCLVTEPFILREWLLLQRPFPNDLDAAGIRFQKREGGRTGVVPIHINRNGQRDKYPEALRQKGPLAQAGTSPSRKVASVCDRTGSRRANAKRNNRGQDKNND